jgi:hypothetical protein
MKTFKIFFIVLVSVFIVYLLLPSPEFPDPPPDAVQSQEEADTETPLRRAYFTNYTREEVLKHYQKQLPWPTYRLNYPPEEAQTLIRDQTRSTFLEEIVRPFRESVFVNGFEPKDPKDDVWYKGVDYRQKIIIRFVPSNVLVRMGIILPAVIFAGFLMREWLAALKDLRKVIRR